jgi:hypothetical protein
MIRHRPRGRRPYGAAGTKKGSPSGEPFSICRGYGTLNPNGYPAHSVRIPMSIIMLIMRLVDMFMLGAE